MTKQTPNEKELMEILEIAKIFEQKLKDTCNMTKSMAKKYQVWYEEATGQKLSEQPISHYEHCES